MKTLSQLFPSSLFFTLIYLTSCYQHEPIAPSLTFSPESGRIGDTVRLTVLGIRDLTINQCVIKFHDAQAGILPVVGQANTTVIFLVTVPKEATTGIISLQAGDVNLNAIKPFIVN
jgi:hypothetical protein